ncbi:hypothetical protein Hanom_Chr11g01028951 [Helianthus anomalus]
MRRIYIVDEMREEIINFSSVPLFALYSSLNLQIFKETLAGIQDQGLFEQITRGFRFPPEWDARYPSLHQTAADAPPGYITLFEDFFLQGNFRLPATEFMAHILQYYGFHISQMSPPGMVRVRHFEFLCRSHDIEPTVEKFRVFYQLIRNMGFYSFGNRGSAKKILLNPPKSFH